MTTPVEEEAAVVRTLAMARTRVGVEVACAAKVHPGGRTMQIRQVHGGLTSSLMGLTVSHGAGLGGKSLALRKPAVVNSYHTARGITHDYDAPVSREQLRGVAALPVFVDGTPRYVLYLGTRDDTRLGDRWLDLVTPLAHDLAREVTISDEVARRSALPRDALDERPMLPDPEVSAVAGELMTLAGAMEDGSVKERLLGLGRRLLDTTTGDPSPGPALTSGPVGERVLIQLTPRELEVLTHAAHGATNTQIAGSLGLQPNTVKSYLKAIARKLGTTNRVQAVVEARRLGVLP